MSRSQGAGRRRWFVVWLLATLLVVLTPLAIAGFWVRAVVLDADRYVATVAPLADDPALQAAVADQVSAQVVEAVDNSGVRDLAVGPLEGLLDNVLEGLETRVREQTTRVVASDAFAEAWSGANRASHDDVVAALTGDGTDVSVRGEAFVEAARAGLTAAGFGALADLVPDIEATFVVYSSDGLPSVQRGVRLLSAVGGWIWAVALAVGVVVVVVAPRRSLGLAAAAGAIALGALMLAAGLTLARAGYVGDPDEALSPAARAAVFDQVTLLLRSALVWTIVVAALALALGVLLRLLSGTPAPSTADQSP